MNQPTTINDAAKETLEIFRYMDDSFVSQIPNEFLAELEKFASQSNKDFQVDAKKKLLEQDVLEETKDLLSFLYYSYGANEAEKREIQKVWNDNEKEYQKKIAEETSMEIVWKKKAQEREVRTLPTVQEPSLWQRIQNMWKQLWKRG